MKLALRLTRRIALMVAMIGFTLGQYSARASTEIQKELGDVAKSIAGVLEQKNENRIAVGQFTGPSRMPSSSGPAIAKALSEELSKLGIMISKRASLEIKGDYLAVVNEKNRGPSVADRHQFRSRSGAIADESP